MYYDHGMSPASAAAGRDVPNPYEESKVLPSTTTETEQADNPKDKAAEAERASKELGERLNFEKDDPMMGLSIEKQKPEPKEESADKINTNHLHELKTKEKKELHDAYTSKD